MSADHWNETGVRDGRSGQMARRVAAQEAGFEVAYLRGYRHGWDARLRERMHDLFDVQMVSRATHTNDEYAGHDVRSRIIVEQLREMRESGVHDLATAVAGLGGIASIDNPQGRWITQLWEAAT